MRVNNEGVHQDCAKSTWMFNILMEETCFEMRVKGCDCGVLLNHGGTEQKLHQLLCEDDTVLLAES